MKVSELMTKDVVTVERQSTLKEVAELLAGRRISGVPVVDRPRRVVGVVSEADIAEKEAAVDRPRGVVDWLLARGTSPRLEARTAGEAMSSPPITLRPDRDVAEAARLMIEQGVNRLPIVDAEGTLVGIVTRADLVRAFIRSDAEIEHELLEDVVLGNLGIDPDTVETSVNEGEVTLTGEVDTKADAGLLETFAARVPGVVSVRSELRWRREKPRLPRSQPYVPIPPRR